MKTIHDSHLTNTPPQKKNKFLPSQSINIIIERQSSERKLMTEQVKLTATFHVTQERAYRQ